MIRSIDTDRIVASVRQADGGWGVILAVVALAAAAVGYAGGSILAGEPAGSQWWMLGVLASCLAAGVAVYVQGKKRIDGGRTT